MKISSWPSLVRAALAVFVMGVGSAGAHLGTSLMPFLVSGLIEGVGMNAAQASLFGSLLIGGYAASMMLISRWVKTLSSRTLALIGTVLAAAANLAVFAGIPPLACHAMGLLAGIGYGLVYSGTISTVARTQWRETALPLGTGVALLLIVITMVFIPVMRPIAGARAPFLLVSVVLAASTVLFAFAGSSEKVADGKGAAPSLTPAVPLFSRRNLVLLVAWSLFSIATASSWAFAERIGQSIGIPADEIPQILSLGTFFSIAGTILATITVNLFRRRTALVVGLLLNGLGAGMIGLAWNVSIYLPAVMLYWAAHMYAYSFMLNAASVLDNSGTLATFGSGAERFAYSIGTLLAGVLVQFGGFTTVSIWTFAVTIAAAGILLLPTLTVLNAKPTRQQPEDAAGDEAVASPTVPTTATVAVKG